MNPTNPVNTFLSAPIVKIVLTVTAWTLLLILLPETPFLQFITGINTVPYLAYLNWFVPFGTCATIMSVWWTAVIVFYAISWILRQLGLLGS